MLLTAAHRIKLFVFLVIAIVSVAYVGINYAGLDRFLGGRGYAVTVRLADSGGIFVGAEVTYRGVAVGKVASMDLTDRGVSLRLDIESDSRPVPADTRAAIANRSAVGEQYVDLLPTDDSPPYLEEGSVVRQDRTSLPIAPETVLTNLDELVSSVDTGSLRTVVDETYDAFAGAGPELQRLLDSTSSLTDTAIENLPQTRSLLADGRVVLRTQRDQAGRIVELSKGLRTIAARLKGADPALRRVIDQAPQLADEVTSVLDESGNDLGVITANLLTTAKITSSRTDALEELLVTFPVISSFTRSVTSNGEGHLGFVLNLFDPPSCTRGYETTDQRPANDESEAPPNTQAYCAEPRGSVTSVRGAQNAPFAGAPEQPVAPGGEDTPSQSGEESGEDGGDGRDTLPGMLGYATDSAATSVGGLLGVP